MKIILSTGIFPPAIGGIATYAEGLAKELAALGHEITVVTYGTESAKWKVESGKLEGESFEVVSVAKSSGFLFRWLRYAEALREVEPHADAVIALSSVSVGIPLIFSGLKKPKRILRLGGDFFWERYTDAGGRKSLREWYGSFGFWKVINSILMPPILHSFSAIVYSTQFQRDIHHANYSALPPTTVIENARPDGAQVSHSANRPFRLLFMGRFVGFKNLESLVTSMKALPDAQLTMVGNGPMEHKLRGQVKALGLQDRIEFRAPVFGAGKRKLFDDHDVLIIPSVTEISPNVALEAASVCLPVLLTDQTGYSATSGITLAPLRTPEQIVAAVKDMMNSYQSPTYDASARDWKKVASDWQTFLQHS